jgi:hypothetical protein
MHPKVDYAFQLHTISFFMFFARFEEITIKLTNSLLTFSVTYITKSYN